LRAATRRWFSDVCETWSLEEHHRRLLVMAARSWDEAEAAAAVIRRDGLVITMPSGARRPNPAIRIANEARAVFMRAIRELDLDLEPPAEAKRPPALRSIVGQKKGA
jgi:phage terminase small subunit